MIKEVHGFQSPKTALLMAFGTVLPKLSLMHVFMAGHAIVLIYFSLNMKNRFGIAPLLVTTKTIHLFVFTPQGKISGTVVKAAHADKIGKARFSMALLTGSLNSAEVGVLVAGRTVCVWHTRKYLKFTSIFDCDFMTFATIYRGMFTLEGKIGLVVVKTGSRTKGLQIVAGNTIV
ncbi:MAG: hypothetical protein D6730_02605 [Bacteroidetes bacterium]|nr:MAG: hypothetical protein D6730_02605 [Bacteroidota bacterium]